MVYPPQGGATSGGSTTFIGLEDVPASYGGQSLKYVRVNTGETALEFSESSGTVAWDGITDKPASFTPDTHGNESHSTAFATVGVITYENLDANGDVGTGAGQVAIGNHTHDYSGTFLGLHATADDSTLWDAYALPATTGNESKYLKLDAAGTAFEFGTGGSGGTWGSITGTLSAQTDLQAVLDTKADVGTTTTYYVYEDATGLGDGSSYENGFTSLQAAINAAPEFCTLVVNVRKGSTNYLGDSTLIYEHAITQITIQGEYYWNAACDANSDAGKIVDADITTTGMAVGDRVVCVHYSGTVGASAIDDLFYATVSEIGAGYVQTSEETKVPTTGWKYIINSTIFDGNNSTNKIIAAGSTPFLTITGLGFVNQALAPSVYVSNGLGVISSCIFYQTRGVQADYGSQIYGNSNAIIGTGAGTYALLHASNNSFIYLTTSGVSGANSYGIQATYGSRVYGKYLNLNGTTYGVYSESSGCQVMLDTCYIESTVTTGLYGYNITSVSGTNNATTPVTNVTSGGRVSEVDINGQTAETAIASDDLITIYDTSETAYRKMTRANFVAGISGNILTDAAWNAAGDLVVGTGDDTATILPMGSALQSLRVNAAANALEFATVSASGDHWISITDGYTATPASTSTITTTSDLTGTLKAGDGLKYTIGGTVYHAQVSVMATNLITIGGAPLSGDISNLYYTKTGVIQMPLLIPGYYEDATATTLVASDLGQTIRWQQRTSYLVNFKAKTRVADTSSDGIVNVRVNGQDISTSNTNAGLTLANTSWTATVVDINTSNYDINYGEEIEVNATKGTGANAQDLSLVLTFVVA